MSRILLPVLMLILVVGCSNIRYSQPLSGDESTPPKNGPPEPPISISNVRWKYSQLGTSFTFDITNAGNVDVDKAYIEIRLFELNGAPCASEKFYIYTLLAGQTKKNHNKPILDVPSTCPDGWFDYAITVKKVVYE